MNVQAEITRLTAELGKHNTSHLAHFILTMITGLWMIVWILVAESDAIHRAIIRNKIGVLQDHDFKPERVPLQFLGGVLVLMIVAFIIAAIAS